MFAGCNFVCARYVRSCWQSLFELRKERGKKRDWQRREGRRRNVWQKKGGESEQGWRKSGAKKKRD